jgi:hypothetical protein
MIVLKEEKLKKLIKITAVFAIVCCCVLLFPQVRNLIIEIGEKILRRGLNHDLWMKRMLMYSLCAISFFSVFLILQYIEERSDFLIEYGYGKKIFVFASLGIAAMSIVVRIVMYVKCRSLWFDEAALAASIVSRNWFELLVPPLLNNQSAPVLYVITEKLIGSIFGYSEFSLRIFSLFHFLGLLVCEVLLLKKAFNLDNFKIAFVAAMTALLPSYIYYSNELKPYMGDAFFAILTILLYFFYKQDKIKLPALTALCILIFGFSTPAIFFTGGILFSEFFIAVFSKNKKQILFIVISGTAVLAVFGLYYYWWMSPIEDFMTSYYWGWGMPHADRLQDIFSPGISNSNSPIVIYFVLFALFGIVSLIDSKNKIAFSVVLSLLFAFLASLIGKWPYTGRLWLFLPAIVLIFTPIGIDFIHVRMKHKKIMNKIEYLLYSITIIYLSVNCLEYTEHKMYFSQEEINPLIYYVQENIKEDEKLYVYLMAYPAFGFKNGYNTMRIGNAAKDNIIYGKSRND